jgi:hypothetical protein
MLAHDMDSIDTGWRNGWELQARRLLATHRISAAPPNSAVDGLSARRLARPDKQKTEIAIMPAANPEPEGSVRLRRRLMEQCQLSRTLNDKVAWLSMIGEAAELRAQALARELAEVRDRLEAELDSVLREKTIVAELLLEKSRALDSARGRVEFLEIELSGAETACEQLTAELAGRSEREEARAAESERREQETFARLTDTQQRLRRAQAEIFEGAADRGAQHREDLSARRSRKPEATMRASVAAERLAHAEQELNVLRASNEIAKRRITTIELARASLAIKNSKLERDLAAQAARIGQLEQSGANLGNALQTLLDAHSGPHHSPEFAKAAVAAPADSDRVASNKTPVIVVKREVPYPVDLADHKPRTREQWVELLWQLNQLVSLKRREPSLTPSASRTSTVSCG